MSHIQTFQVFPAVPQPLRFLEILSRNMWWSWNLDAIELFRRIDPVLWEESGRNPINFSTLIPQKRLEKLAEDESFLSHQERIRQLFELEVESPLNPPDSALGKEDCIAYFSMEFGIHESLPLFAGGLGILAGDHLKAASDLGLPLVGIGLLYRCGYFHQYLDPNGWQQEEYPETDYYHLPLRRAKDPAGNEIHVSLAGPDGDIHAMVWKIMVGRIPLYLLDTNIQENPPEIRDITYRLYDGGQKRRLAQEALLGIGGMRALAAMQIEPTVCHMNEGHSAFAGLERLAQIMPAKSVDLKTAKEIVPRTTVFTTHTPVAAGHDEFPADMVVPYLVDFEDKLGVSAKEILSWGQAQGPDANGELSMFILAIHMAQFCNGVSRLHGNVARRMWAHVWPGRPEDEVPITHITNGVHVSSWISVENALLFERHLGPDWYLSTQNQETIDRIDEIYDEELWRAHEMSRSRLIRTCRKLMVKQYSRRNAPKKVIEEAETALDQKILTIGFARRVATYKRANLLLQNPDRLEAMIMDEKRPVQFIFAGKAHPKDDQGKELIKLLIEFASRPGVRQRMVFLEDYDINIARHLNQGADVWLNTPRRPFEACGTSGMKAAVNGVLNLSVLDGWWCEGYSEERGWRIGNGEEYGDPAYQDAVESQALYNTLENDVIPSFYDRKHGGLPDRWLSMMKASMKMGLHNFCSQIMVNNYEKKFYQSAASQFHTLTTNESEAARNLAAQHERLDTHWKDIHIAQPVPEKTGPFRVGETFQVTCEVDLGALTPDEVDVEIYYGLVKSIDTLTSSETETMDVMEERGNGKYLYGCTLTCRISGRYGFTARVIPRGDDWIRFAPGLISWA
ncbi:MAG: alpha-glucan family phosphorylase [Deltaproteobacteria bacterium]|jgi:starch phosphorylase|nr:alpha-glucan family phosphorylase [Deltaproteobacteria bacterium]